MKFVEQDGEFFHSSYEECRERFINSFNRMAQAHPGASLSAFQVGDSTNNHFIDFGFLPALESEQKALIVTTGEHGVEGYVGSAIQAYMLDHWVHQIDLKSTSITLIHAVNPWGFVHNRRVTENNVDLNRNFFTQDEWEALDNRFYQNLSDLMNPQKPVKFNYLSFFKTILSFVYFAQKLGLSAVREATLKGQKSVPNGLFYCGAAAEPQNLQILSVFRERAKAAKSLLHLSLHTGFGERGKMHLIQPVVVDEQVQAQLNHIFSDVKVNGCHDENFYRVFGGLQEHIHSLVKNEVEYLPMTLEFGTVDNHTVVGGIKSLVTMIRESQGHHFGYRSERDRVKVLENYLEHYYPSCKEWRRSTLNQAIELLQLIQNKYLI